MTYRTDDFFEYDYSIIFDDYEVYAIVKREGVVNDNGDFSGLFTTIEWDPEFEVPFIMDEDGNEVPVDTCGFFTSDQVNSIYKALTNHYWEQQP